MIRIDITNHSEVVRSQSGPFQRFFGKILNALSVINLEQKIDDAVLERLVDGLSEHGLVAQGHRVVPDDKKASPYLLLDLQNLEELVATELEKHLGEAGIQIRWSVGTPPPEPSPSAESASETGTGTGTETEAEAEAVTETEAGTEAVTETGTKT